MKFCPKALKLIESWTLVFAEKFSLSVDIGPTEAYTRPVSRSARVLANAASVSLVGARF